MPVDTTIVSLDKVAAQEGLSVADRVTLRTQYLREGVAGAIMVLSSRPTAWRYMPWSDWCGWTKAT
jgi:hypothetical protein